MFNVILKKPNIILIISLLLTISLTSGLLLKQCVEYFSTQYKYKKEYGYSSFAKCFDDCDALCIPVKQRDEITGKLLDVLVYCIEVQGMEQRIYDRMKQKSINSFINVLFYINLMIVIILITIYIKLQKIQKSKNL